MSLVGSIIARARWIGAAKTSKSAVAFTLLSRVFMLIINVANGVVVARSLGPEGRGTASAIQLWPILISGLMTLGIPSALRYQVRRRLDHPEELFTTSLLMSALLGVFAVGVGIVVLPHSLAKYSPAVITFAMWMMLFAPIMMCCATLQAFCESKGDFAWASSMLYGPPLICLTGLLILLPIHLISPYTIPFVYESSFAIVTLTTIIRLRSSIRFPTNVLATARLQLNYGLRAYGMDIIGTLAAQVDQAMVVGLLSASSFGLYAVANNGARILTTLNGALNTVLVPTASALNGPDAIELVSRAARVATMFTIAGAIVLDVALPVLVPLAYGDEYRPIIPLIQLLTVAMVLLSLSGTLVQAFMATGRPEIATGLQCVSICITVCLMLLLIPRFGLRGVAYAVDAAAAVRVLLCLLSYPIFLRHKIPRLLITRADLQGLIGRLQPKRT